jgi:hypothetical protein
MTSSVQQQVDQQMQQGLGIRGSRAQGVEGVVGSVGTALQRVWSAVCSLDVCGRCCPGCDAVGAMQHVRWLVANVWATLQQPHIRGCAIFIFLWQVRTECLHIRAPLCASAAVSAAKAIPRVTNSNLQVEKQGLDATSPVPHVLMPGPLCSTVHALPLVSRLLLPAGGPALQPVLHRVHLPHWKPGGLRRWVGGWVILLAVCSVAASWGCHHSWVMHLCAAQALVTLEIVWQRRASVVSVFPHYIRDGGVFVMSVTPRHCASRAGVLLYNVCLVNRSIRTTLLWCAIVGTLFNAVQLIQVGHSSWLHQVDYCMKFQSPHLLLHFACALRMHMHIVQAMINARCSCCVCADSCNCSQTT